MYDSAKRREPIENYFFLGTTTTAMPIVCRGQKPCLFAFLACCSMQAIGRAIFLKARAVLRYGIRELAMMIRGLAS
jgi:hypothetical protein